MDRKKIYNDVVKTKIEICCNDARVKNTNQCDKTNNT